MRRLYQREQAEQDKSDAQRFHALLQVLGRTCLDAATDEPFCALPQVGGGQCGDQHLHGAKSACTIIRQ